MGTSYVSVSIDSLIRTDEQLVIVYVWPLVAGVVY
jgi:hypothetical protein